jgi:hypothetical protein
MSLRVRFGREANDPRVQEWEKILDYLLLRQVGKPLPEDHQEVLLGF